MRLRVEFKARRRLSTAEGSYFSSMLLHQGSLVEESRGLDVFAEKYTLKPRDILGGLGRRAPSDRKGEAEAVRGKAFSFEYSCDDNVSLMVFNDIFMTSEQMAENLEVQLISPGGEKLSIPLKGAEWAGRGMFVIPIGKWVKKLQECSPENLSTAAGS